MTRSLNSSLALFGLVLAALLPAQTALAQEPPAGKYECWLSGRALMTANFTVLGGGRYADDEGRGTYTASGGRLVFRGGVHDGRRGVYLGGNPPTISFVNERGDEVFLCQLAR
jgi:hypothetical protein